jgi:predicted DNA-binding ArsR family transcriptional regulator
LNTHFITTTDLFEVTFLITAYSFVIENVQVIPQNKNDICQFTIAGDERLSKAQLEYFNNEGNLKVLDFRRNLHKVNTLIGMAKKNYRQELKASKLQESIAPERSDL